MVDLVRESPWVLTRDSIQALIDGRFRATGSGAEPASGVQPGASNKWMFVTGRNEAFRALEAAAHCAQAVYEQTKTYCRPNSKARLRI